jgi:hypothetical protein
MNRARVRIAILATPLVGFGFAFGCLGQAERTYFDDLVDGSMPPGDGSVEIDSSMPDAKLVATDAPEASLDAGATPDAGPDSGPVESGCGPTDTVTSCGQCGAACDTTHGTPSSCTSGACQYGCNAGWGDCDGAAPNLNGCETPLDTPSNCTGCGVACDTAHSNGASCSGAGCTYASCAAGYLDCHTAAPNSDGCECNAPACCEGGVCEPLHNNGMDQNFYDCTPIGAYNAGLAFNACIAFTGSAAACVSFPCKDPGNGPIVCSSGDVTEHCMCWSSGGGNAGLVDNGGTTIGDSGSKYCFCPAVASGDRPWY